MKTLADAIAKAKRRSAASGHEWLVAAGLSLYRPDYVAMDAANYEEPDIASRIGIYGTDNILWSSIDGAYDTTEDWQRVVAAYYNEDEAKEQAHSFDKD